LNEGEIEGKKLNIKKYFLSEKRNKLKKSRKTKSEFKAHTAKSQNWF
jgi:hypothetical protein